LNTDVCTKALRHSVILCSLGRPRELEIAIRNLTFQILAPEMIIIVVTSDQDLSEEIISLRQTLLQKGIQLEIFISDPGLTKQRNFGLSKVQKAIDVVHFFDDDVILPPDYLEIVDSIFRSTSDVIGVGGRTIDNVDYDGNLIERFFLLNSKSSGKLLASGINIGFRYSHNPYKVDWLPGCTMSYSASKISHMKFDESREGVGWGEDVDFSSRASKLGTLVIFSHPRILHTKSTIARVSDLERSLKNDNSRIKMSRRGIGGIKIQWILWSFFGEIVIGSKILKIYFKSLLDLLKQFSKSILRLVKVLSQFIVEFWKLYFYSFKFLNVFSLRITFPNINKLIIKEARFFAFRVKNFYKQLTLPKRSRE